MTNPISTTASYHHVRRITVRSYIPENDNSISLSLISNHLGSNADVILFGLPSGYASAIVDAINAVNAGLSAADGADV